MLSQDPPIRRTRAEKRRSVEDVFRDPLYRTLSDRLIGKYCGVSPALVASVRKAFAATVPANTAIRKGEAAHV